MVRHRVVAVLVLVVLLGLSSATGAAAVAAAAQSGSDRSEADPAGDQVVKAGWWWAGNQPPAETGVVAYPQHSPPNVPPGSLPVAAAAGDPEKISAIELRLDVETGGTAESAHLVLQESSSPGASTNVESAKILACPVTEPFWADGTAARWDYRPAYDCDLAQAEGARRETGRWVFDLTTLAALWLGESPTSPSFVLVEAVDSPESFQVAFEGLAADGVRFKASYLPASTDLPGQDDPGEAPGGAVDGTAGQPVGGSASGGGLPSGSGSSGGGSADAPASLTDPGADADAGAGAGAGAPAEEGTVTTASSPSTDAAPVAATAGEQPWHTGLIKPAVILVPLVLAVAYLAMVALGPDAQPTVATARHGVSRALERLRLGTSKATGKVVR